MRENVRQWSIGIRLRSDGEWMLRSGRCPGEYTLVSQAYLLGAFAQPCAIIEGHLC